MTVLASHYITAKFIQITNFMFINIYKYISNIFNKISFFYGLQPRVVPKLSEKGFIKVMNLRYNYNKGISEELKGLYPSLVPVPILEIPEVEIHS